MLSILQSMYTQASSVLLINNDISFQFPYKRGIVANCPDIGGTVAHAQRGLR